MSIVYCDSCLQPIREGEPISEAQRGVMHDACLNVALDQLSQMRHEDPRAEAAILSHAEAYRLVTECQEQCERTEKAEAEVARLREAVNVAGSGLAATYALLNRFGDADGAAACMRMIEAMDAALSGQAEGAAGTSDGD